MLRFCWKMIQRAIFIGGPPWFVGFIVARAGAEVKPCYNKRPGDRIKRLC